LIDDEIKFKIEELMVRKRIDRLKEDIKIDIDKAVSIAEKQVKDKEIKEKISKIIAVLSNDGKKQIWNVTCFLQGLQLINLHVDALSGKVLKSEKMALSDFFNKPADYMG
jgi:Zn-dependent metalloprotease